MPATPTPPLAPGKPTVKEDPPLVTVPMALCGAIFNWDGRLLLAIVQ